MPSLLEPSALLTLLASLAPLTASTTPEAPVDPDLRGVFITVAGAEETRFAPWAGNYYLQGEVNRLVAAGGGELRFAPGDYEFDLGLSLHGARGITFAGSPATRLYFAPEPERRPSLQSAVNPGDTSIVVDDASGMVRGRAYQLYPADLTGDRVLEFFVQRVEGTRVHLAAPVSYMQHVSEIPAGCVVIEQINFFKIVHSDEITIEDLVLDGRGRGDVAGHTTYCGVYAVGTDPSGAEPRTSGLRVRGCTLDGLDGRGIAVYRTLDVTVESCDISGVVAEAVELDHHSQGRVVGCRIADANVGVALNDAFDSIVERNTISSCGAAVSFVRHLDSPALNRGNLVRDNLISCPSGVGIAFRSGITGNTVRANRFADMPRERWIRDPGENTVELNVTHE